MRYRKRLSSGDLLLLELIFAIVFFSLAMAASMSVFGNAYEMSSKAEKLDSAIRESDSAAEMIRSSGTEDEINYLFTNNGYSVSPDGEFSKEYNNGKSIIVITTSVDGKLFTGDIACYDAPGKASEKTAEPVYDISIKHALTGSEKEGGRNG